MAETVRHKVGTSRGVERSRIWLEGNRVLAAGFAVGMHFERIWNDAEGVLVLRVTGAKGPRATSGTVSGKGERPILDIVGERVREVFGKYSDRVDVRYGVGQIAIGRVREGE